jgi:nitroreductase
VTARPYPPLPTFTEAERIAAARAFAEALATRRSCRAFAPTPVDAAVIEWAIRAAASAPSGANHQPWHFVAIGIAETKRRVREAAEAEERAFYAGRAGAEWLSALHPLGTGPDKPYLEAAPWLIAIFAQRHGAPSGEANQKNYYVAESVGIATGLLIVALHRAGLATLTHTPAPMGFLRDICGRPAHEKPFLLLVVGHPAQDATVPAHATQRRPLAETLSWR